MLEDRHDGFLMVLGRLRPGVTLDAAAAHVAVLSSQLKRDAEVDAVDRKVTVVPIWQSPYGAQTYMLPAVMVMSAMAGLLLLIVCANIAGLVLVRGISRRGEIAARLALGATRTRIVRLLLAENLVMAIPGSILGLAVVWLGLPFLSRAPRDQRRPGRLFFDISVDRLGRRLLRVDRRGERPGLRTDAGAAQLAR